MIQTPQANYYQPQPIAPQSAAKPQSQYNAVKIDIIEPKVNTPGSQLTNAYYQYPNAPQYQNPTASAYATAQASQTTQGPAAVPQYAPVQQQTVSEASPQVINQQYVMPQQSQVQQPAAATVPVPPPAPEQTQATANPVPAPAAEQAAQTVDVAKFAETIKGSDPENVGKAIEEVALIAQNNPAEAVQLLDENLMSSLLGVIANDTASLQGPTPKQIELRQQIMAGKTLSEADAAEAKKVTPLEMAERNKQYALFTVAILQNLLVNEFKKANNVTPDIKDLPGMEQIVLTIKDNPNPMLRASGLAALAYNARPEYTPVMKEIFELSKNDADENVQKVAAEGLSKLEQVK